MTCTVLCFCMVIAHAGHTHYGVMAIGGDSRWCSWATSILFGYSLASFLIWGMLLQFSALWKNTLDHKEYFARNFGHLDPSVEQNELQCADLWHMRHSCAATISGRNDHASISTKRRRHWRKHAVALHQTVLPAIVWNLTADLPKTCQHLQQVRWLYLKLLAELVGETYLFEERHQQIHICPINLFTCVNLCPSSKSLATPLRQALKVFLMVF